MGWYVLVGSIPIGIPLLYGPSSSFSSFPFKGRWIITSAFGCALWGLSSWWLFHHPGAVPFWIALGMLQFWSHYFILGDRHPEGY